MRGKGKGKGRRGRGDEKGGEEGDGRWEMGRPCLG